MLVMLSTDGAGEFPATVSGVRVVGASVRTTFEVDGSIWSRLRSDQAFHASPSTLGPSATDFAADAIVAIDTQLSPRIARGLVAVDPSASLVRSLLGSPEPSVMHRCASWYVRSCAVPVEVDAGVSMSEGFRTAWGARPDREDLPLVGYVAEHLDRRGWSASPLDSAVGFTWHLTGTHTSWTATVLVDDDAHRCTIYSVLADVVPEARRSDALDRVNRLNVGQVTGSWEVTDRGSVRMRSALEVGRTAAPDDAIALTIDRHLDTFDEIVPEVLDLLGD